MNEYCEKRVIIYIYIYSYIQYKCLHKRKNYVKTYCPEKADAL